MRFGILALISVTLASAQMRDVHYQGWLTPLNVTPTFDNGYLAAYDRDPSIAVYAADGALMYRASAHGPDGRKARINSTAVDGDGTLAAAIEYSVSSRISGPGADWPRGGGIALFDRSGAEVRLIGTGLDYWPAQVAFGADHSIWTTGYLGRSAADPRADYLALRHYSQNGEMLGAFLPRSAFPHPADPQREPLILSMHGLWELRVANNRVEIMLPRVDLWAQTDLKRRETGRWNVGPTNQRPRAFTQDGRAWRQMGKQVMLFDRAEGTWSRPVLQISEGGLIGADGNVLVFLMPDRETTRWIPAPVTTSAN